MAVPKTDIRSCSGLDKAAMIMLSLGEEHASKMFGMMEDDEIKDLSQRMSTLGILTNELVEKLFVEFVQQISGTGSLVGSYESVERLLHNTLGKERVDSIMEDIRGPAGRTMWDKLANVNEQVVGPDAVKHSVIAEEDLFGIAGAGDHGVDEVASLGGGGRGGTEGPRPGGPRRRAGPPEPGERRRVSGAPGSGAEKRHCPPRLPRAQSRWYRHPSGGGNGRRIPRPRLRAPRRAPWPRRPRLPPPAHPRPVWPRAPARRATPPSRAAVRGFGRSPPRRSCAPRPPPPAEPGVVPQRDLPDRDR